ncbi:MAG: phosphopyruvate hydratase [Sphaerochaeta sp.]|nr:phosphopyruvate hydratase [Sphaerochaeta sp.]
METIIGLKGREILNAKGNPTVEAELITSSGLHLFASVPSGASTGKYEAFELYDGGTRYGGRGTLTAANTISTSIRDALIGMDVTRQSEIDGLLCSLDGTANKSRLGANAILPVSLAVARAAASSMDIPLFEYINSMQAMGSMGIPDIIATVISGGVFSPSGLEFEDYMYVLGGFEAFSDQLEALVRLRRHLEKIVCGQFGVVPEDGGALAPPIRSSEEAFDLMLECARDLGLEDHVSLGIDVAASELFDEGTGTYSAGIGHRLSKQKLIDRYVALCEAYPLTLIEDGVEENDFDGFCEISTRMPSIQVVGDDLFATNVSRIQTGIEMKSANTLLLKVNQIGTLTEALAASRLAQSNGMDVIVSLRSGETEDDFIADLAVGIGARQIKLGSPVRLERNTKYNRLLRISENLSAPDKKSF